nr:unnamed protein product [Callosobruchus chinensis]
MDQESQTLKRPHPPSSAGSAAKSKLQDTRKILEESTDSDFGASDISIHLQNRRPLYKAQIRPTVEYVPHIWGAAASTTLSIIVAVQRRAI